MTKITLVVLFVGTSLCAFSQSHIGTANSGASSENALMYSVGEVYVIPADVDETASGSQGVLSQINLQLLSTEDYLLSEDVRVYPNPVMSGLSFRMESDQQLKKISVYSINGALVAEREVTDNKVDVSFLSIGTYFIQTNIKNMKPFKIIKK